MKTCENNWKNINALKLTIKIWQCSFHNFDFLVDLTTVSVNIAFSSQANKTDFAFEWILKSNLVRGKFSILTIEGFHSYCWFHYTVVSFLIIFFTVPSWSKLILNLTTNKFQLVLFLILTKPQWSMYCVADTWKMKSMLL